MPLFSHTGNQIKQLSKISFINEKELQDFIETNLKELFGIRFLKSEYTTTKNHGGRIDSLGIDDNDCPVIIEYKWGEKDNIINQGLFYLDWLVDHQGDFKVLVQEKLGINISVDFRSPRVILVAQTFNKYDKYAINRMPENIELWSYSKYENNIFELKLVASSHAKKSSTSKVQISKVDYPDYSIDNHISAKSKKIKQLFYDLQEKIFKLETTQQIEETPLKLYIAYRASKVFIQVWVKKQSINIHFKTELDKFKDPLNLLNQVSDGVKQRGVYCEFVVNEFDDIETAISFIEQSYLQSI